jgi:PleD family two-component response regulator
MKASDAESSQWKARMNTILTNTTVLVVDDDEDTCELLRNILEKRGANVVTGNSAEAPLSLYIVFTRPT